MAEGLWEMEGEDGQLYLAVKARPWRPARSATYTSDVDLGPDPPLVSLPRRRVS